MKISYINEMAALCEKVGADVHDIARGMGLDQRIGPKFLHPGPGYGGSCFPKDTQAILATAEEYGERLRIIGAAVAVNDDQPRRMVDKLREAVGGSLEGRTVAMLGLAFKPNTDDVRESAALKIAEQVIEEGGRVRAFDPIAVDTARAAGYSGAIGEDEYSTCQGADVVALVTEWNQFRNLDLQRIKQALARPVLVDMRNIYEREDVEKRGLQYLAVGR
ncbi:MAG TPA: UDP-glucose/GDP-mannose dehydrogenase family protein [Acidobacteria bacterium]|nr:UDP-glucose/GDP-mannose dehydrogenase family protein [Acidobacteriota bacterium]